MSLVEHKSERFGTENFEAEVQLYETDREKFKIGYDLYKVNHRTIPFTNKQFVFSKKRIDTNYYGRPHKTWNLDGALDAFEDCKDYLMARMEKREEHIESFNSEEEQG